MLSPALTRRREGKPGVATGGTEPGEDADPQAAHHKDRNGLEYPPSEP